MDLAVLVTWVLSVLLISVRFSVAFALSPVFTSYGIPAIARLALILAMSTLVYQAGAVSLTATVDTSQIIAAVGAEAVNGVLLGLAVHVALAAFALAGRMLDIQIGFGLGSVFDPVTRSSANVLGSLLALLGVMLFIAADAHLALASLLAASFDVVPLGTLPPVDDPLKVASAAGAMFAFGLALAAPVVLALFLTDVIVGIISRNSPQINVLVLSMPLKVLVGIFVLAIAMVAWAPLVERLFHLTSNVLGGSR